MSQDDLGSVSSPATVIVVVYGTPQQLDLTSAPYWVRPASSGATDHRYPMLNNLGGFVYDEQVGGQWQVFGTPTADVNPGQLTVPDGGYTEALSPGIADDGSFICTRNRTNNGAAGQILLTDVLRYPGPAVAATNPAATYVFQANDWRNVNGYGSTYDGGLHASLSCSNTAIFSYSDSVTLMWDDYDYSYLADSVRGTISLDDQWQGDYPDLNADGHFVFANGSQVYLDNNPVLSGQFAHINDAPRDNPEIVYVSGNNLMSSRVGQFTDYNGQALTGSWVDINRSGVLIFEKLVGTNYQVFKAYLTEPRIVSTGGTNALVGLPYRYDSDNIAEAYGDPEPDDPRNITPIYWSKVSGPAGFHIDGSSGHIDWIPDAPGTYTVVISAAFTYLDDLTEADDQQTLTIQVAQSAFEVVDAVDFRSGNSPDLFTDPTQYLSGGAPRIGATADGASRLVLRVVLKGAETNSFPSLHFAIAGTNQIADGLLQSITGTNWAGDVPASIGSVGGTNWAVGLYQSPADFDIASQPVTVVLLNGSNIIASQNVLLQRPPVVLVHDQWSGPGEFAVLFSSLVDAGMDAAFADYSPTSGGGFATNVAGLYETVADAISGLRHSGFAASRVDMIGHGAGGILTRLHAQRHSVQGDNYGLGDVHKLITIGTPHGGSWLASVITALQATNPSAYANLRNTILSASQASGYVPAIDPSQGVLADESYGSTALADLQSVAVPSHAIATTTSATPPSDIYSFIQLCLGLTSGSGAGVPPADDGFATVDSQIGGIASNATTLLTNVPHLWQSADSNVAALVVGLLKEPIAGSPHFASFPATVWGTNQPPIPAAQTNSGSWLVLSGLTNGQTVFAGQSAILTAAATDARPINAVQFLSPVGTIVDTAAPWDFSFAIPTNAAGAWRVMAAALDTNGQLATALLVLNVTIAATLQSIQVDPPVVSLTSVAPFALHVWGLYSDGILRDITDGSTGTRYKSSDHFQISVNPTNGVLTAKGNTTTNITISITNGVVFTNVQVKANLFNLPPTALITVTSTNGGTGPAPLDVQFSGAASADPEAGALTYLWDFGDGTSSVGQIPSRHRFIAPGSHVVRLTVTDPAGLTARETFTVTVEPWFLMVDASLTLTQRLAFSQVIVTNGGALTASAGLDCGNVVLSSSSLSLESNSTAGGILIQSGQLFSTIGLAAADIAATNAVVVLNGVTTASNFWGSGGQFNANGDLRFADIAVVSNVMVISGSFAVRDCTMISNTMSIVGRLLARDWALDGGTNVVAGTVWANSATLRQGGVLRTTRTNVLDLYVTNTLVVGSNSWLDATGQGYGAVAQAGGRGEGPGGGSTGTCGGGASYGGLGGYQQGGNPLMLGPAYGSFAEPADFGSGGGLGWAGPAWPGSGGGQIRLCAHQLQVDGTVAADGGSGTGSATGGGSGGTIHIITDTLLGSGIIRANGGSNTCDQAGSGGGGRVALYYGDMVGFTGRIQAYGGAGSVYKISQNGAAGTVFLKKTSSAYGDLIIDNADVATPGWSTPVLAEGILRLNSFTVARGAQVSTSAGVRVLTGDPTWFAGLISSSYLQVGSLWVNSQWVYGDTMELEAGMAGGSPRISFFTKPNQPYVIEASTNLSLWTPVLTNASTNGIFEWIETNTVQRRFFRSRQ